MAERPRRGCRPERSLDALALIALGLPTAVAVGYVVPPRDSAILLQRLLAACAGVLGSLTASVAGLLALWRPAKAAARLCVVAVLSHLTAVGAQLYCFIRTFDVVPEAGSGMDVKGERQAQGVGSGVWRAVQFAIPLAAVELLCVLLELLLAARCLATSRAAVYAEDIAPPPPPSVVQDGLTPHERARRAAEERVRLKAAQQASQQSLQDLESFKGRALQVVKAW